MKAKLIKVQHNVMSSNRIYGGKFIPIMHEEVLVLKWMRSATER